MTSRARFSRLWIRLWLAFSLVLFVALAAAAYVALQSTTQAFQTFILRGAALQQDRLQQTLGRYFDAKGDWDGVGLVLESIGPVNGGPIVLRDQHGHPIAGIDPAGRPVRYRDASGQPWQGRLGAGRHGPGESPPLPEPLEASAPPAAGRVIPIPNQAGEIVGEVHLPPPGEVGLVRERRNADFLATLGRSLLLGALVGALVAFVVSLLASRRVVQPIEALTRAVRRLGAGDLDQRVAVDGVAEIAELAGAFNTMAEQLARDRQLRQHLVADVAHELRTPLTNVQGYLEALRDGVIEARPEMLASLHEEAVLLGRLVEDLQELSLAEAGQLRIDSRPVPVDTLLDQAVSAATAAALAKQIRLGVDPLPDLPPVLADERRIAQVLRNLLANAIAYTPAGGEVRLSAHRAEDQVAIAVADTGPGIPTESLDLVFERFYRTDRSRARATGGAGLGLTIARQLVIAHGGRIWASSAPGAGATFTFTVPVAEARPAERRPSILPRPVGVGR